MTCDYKYCKHFAAHPTKPIENYTTCKNFQHDYVLCESPTKEYEVEIPFWSTDDWAEKHNIFKGYRAETIRLCDFHFNLTRSYYHSIKALEGSKK